MDIKVKNLIEEHGYILYTLVIEDKEIKCAAMHKDIEIDGDLHESIYEIGEEFGYKIRDKVKEVVHDFLSTYEGKIIGSYSKS